MTKLTPVQKAQSENLMQLFSGMSKNGWKLSELISYYHRQYDGKRNLNKLVNFLAEAGAIRLVAGKDTYSPEVMIFWNR